MATKKIDLETLILKLLDVSSEIDIHRVAKAAGLSVGNPADRRAIQRAFKRLIEQEVIQAQGAARARVYRFSEKKPRAAALGQPSRPQRVF